MTVFAEVADDSVSDVSSGAWHLPVSLPTVLLYGFAIVMAVHAAREGRWLWVALLLAMPFSAIWYFTGEYRKSPMRGFELPGAADRARVRRLEGEIARCGFPRPDLHLNLGELRLRQGKLDEAKKHLRLAYEADSADIDAASLYGQALLRSGDAKSALPLLHKAVTKSPKHGYGYTAMAYAEALAADGRPSEAISVWRDVLKSYEYDRAKVQFAGLLLAKGDKNEAKALLDDVVDQAKHHSSLNRKSDRVWIRRAKSLKRRL